MRLNTIRIDDFGCFRNARLDNLSENLVVIGGPQRAGKTTFMNALRQFRGGIRRGDDIPPKTDEYRIDAEITHRGYQYRHILNGHAKPSISPINGGPEITVDDVFSPVTDRQYRQLYTISLDELRRLPPGIDDAEDLAKVLLGGAYGDIAEIPEIQEKFRKRAHEIGLSTGSPTNKTSDLNQPYKSIKEGMETRRLASKQVDEHQEVTQELKKKSNRKQEIEDKLEAKRRARNQLNILSEVFDPVQRIDELEIELAKADVPAAKEFPTDRNDRLAHFEEQFDEALDDLETAARAFEQETTLSISGYREWLLEKEDTLTRLEAERKLWADTVNNLTEQEIQLEEQRSEIESEISKLHRDWDGSFTHVEAVATNSVETGRVKELVESIRDLKAKQADLKDEIESNRTRRDELENQLAGMEETAETQTEVTLPKQKPLIIAAAAIAASTGGSLVISPVIGGIVGIIIIAIGMYAIDSTVLVEPTIDTEPRRELKATVATLSGDIDTDEQRLEDIEDQLETKEQELTALTTELGLPNDLPSSQVSLFYKQVVVLQTKLDSYRREYRQWEDKRDELASELADVANTLESVSEISWSKEAPLENASLLLSTLEAAADDLQLAIDVRAAERTRESCISDIDSVLVSWDDEKSIDSSTDDEAIYRQIKEFQEQAQKTAEILDAVEERKQLKSQVTSRLGNPSAQEEFTPVAKDDESLTEAAEEMTAQFADVDAIEDKIRDLKSEIGNLEGQRDDLHEQCLELKKELDELASEEDLRKAQAQIDEGHIEFECVGEAYAVNRIAEDIVRRLHERLMEDVVHSLIDDASAIFTSITQEYDGIELGGELQNLEFRALRSTGPDHGIGELSRATAEQLFLAVRLARIRQTDAELPVVLDDAATNFDPDHISRVFEVISELSTTNQVIFLTCHPEFVNLASACGSSTQYWSLKDGKFTRADDAGILERQLMAD